MSLLHILGLTSAVEKIIVVSSYNLAAQQDYSTDCFTKVHMLRMVLPLFGTYFLLLKLLSQLEDLKNIRLGDCFYWVFCLFWI